MDLYHVIGYLCPKLYQGMFGELDKCFGFMRRTRDQVGLNGGACLAGGEPPPVIKQVNRS